MFGFMRIFRRGPVEVTLSPESIAALSRALTTQEHVILASPRKAYGVVEPDEYRLPTFGEERARESAAAVPGESVLEQYELHTDVVGHLVVKCRRIEACSPAEWPIAPGTDVAYILQTVTDHEQREHSATVQTSTGESLSPGAFERTYEPLEDRPDPESPILARTGSDTRPDMGGESNEGFSEGDLMRRAADEQMRRRPETSDFGSSGEDSTTGGMREELRSISEDQGYRSATDRVLGEDEVREYASPEMALWVREGKVWHLTERIPRLTICGLAVSVIRSRRELPNGETPQDTAYAICPNCERIAQGGAELRAAIESGFVTLPAPSVDDWYRAQQEARERAGQLEDGLLEVEVFGEPQHGRSFIATTEEDRARIPDLTASDVRPESPEMNLAAEAYVDTEGDYELGEGETPWVAVEGVPEGSPQDLESDTYGGLSAVGEIAVDVPQETRTCPKCGHAYHLKPCLNMASDGECASGCMTSLPDGPPPASSYGLAAADRAQGITLVEDDRVPPNTLIPIVVPVADFVQRAIDEHPAAPEGELPSGGWVQDAPDLVKWDGDKDAIVQVAGVTHSHWLRWSATGPWHLALTDGHTACEINMDSQDVPAQIFGEKPEEGPWCLVCTQHELHEGVELEHTVLDTEEEPWKKSSTMGAETFDDEPDTPPDDVQREAERAIRERLHGSD